MDPTRRYDLRRWTTACGGAMLLACNAILGMDELSRGPGGGVGLTASGGTNEGGASDHAGGLGGKDVAPSDQSGADSGGSGGGSGAGGAPLEVCVPDSTECRDGHALHCNSTGTDYESDTECSADQSCVAGVCEDHECEPGSSFCSGNQVLKCRDDGLSSAPTKTCEVNQYCDEATATCEDGVCAPSKPACNGNIATMCDASGSDYEAGGTACDVGTTCQSGICAEHVCTPDAIFCQGKDLKRCAQNGLSSSVVETCAANEYCSAQGEGSCPGQVCSPGSRTCSGNSSLLCNPMGSDTTETMCTDGFCDESSGGCRTIDDVVGALDGRLLQLPCAASSSLDDCTAKAVVDGTSITCNGNPLNVVLEHPIGGTPGVSYDVTIHFYGVVEPKNYGSNVTREADDVRPQNVATGATPAPWASAAGDVTITSSSYTTYEIHVLDEDGVEHAQYFVNSDTAEGHWTYVVNYSKTIPVIGGGSVRVRSYDQNCRIIKNCTMGPAPCAAKARSLNVSAASPAPALMQPGLGQDADNAGQWLLFDVTAVSGSQ